MIKMKIYVPAVAALLTSINSYQLGAMDYKRPSIWDVVSSTNTSVTNNYNKALSNAVAEQDVEKLINLLKHKIAPINQKVLDDALLSMAHKGVDAIAKILLDNDANIDTQDPQTESTPLIGATMKGHNNCVKLFLHYKAKPSIKGIRGHSALSFAINQGYSNSLEIQNQIPYQDITSQLLTAFYEKIFLSEHLSSEQKNNFLCELKEKYISAVDVADVTYDKKGIKELVCITLLCLPELINCNKVKFFDNFLCTYHDFADEKEKLGAYRNISNNINISNNY